MKFKINKTFTKEPKWKFRNQKNKNWNWNTNNKEKKNIIFRGRERKKSVIVTNWTININTQYQQENNIVGLLMT
jgi:hypothetical protein